MERNDAQRESASQDGNRQAEEECNRCGARSAIKTNFEFISSDGFAICTTCAEEMGITVVRGE